MLRLVVREKVSNKRSNTFSGLLYDLDFQRYFFYFEIFSIEISLFLLFFFYEVWVCRDWLVQNRVDFCLGIRCLNPKSQQTKISILCHICLTLKSLLITGKSANSKSIIYSRSNNDHKENISKSLWIISKTWICWKFKRSMFVWLN